MTKILKLIIFLIILIALIVVGFLLFPKTSNHDGEVVVDEIDTSDWKTYRNEEYGFKLKYPGKLIDSWGGTKNMVAELKIDIPLNIQIGYQKDASYKEQDSGRKFNFKTKQLGGNIPTYDLYDKSKGFLSAQLNYLGATEEEDFYNNYTEIIEIFKKIMETMEFI